MYLCIIGKSFAIVFVFSIKGMKRYLEYVITQNKGAYVYRLISLRLIREYRNMVLHTNFVRAYFRIKKAEQNLVYHLHNKIFVNFC